MLVSVYVENAEGALVGVVSIRDVVAEVLAKAFDLRA
jgi:CBS domain-containing protein